MTRRRTDQAHGEPGKYRVFRYEQAPTFGEAGMMSVPEGAPETVDAYQAVRDAGADDGSIVRTLYRQEATPSFSLVHTYLKPGRVIPRHSHNVDCLYCVTWGSIISGNQELRSGDGVFIPAGHPYTFKAGERGGEFLEFRSEPFFDMQMRDDSGAGWERLRTLTEQLRPGWLEETVPPSRLEHHVDD